MIFDKGNIQFDRLVIECTGMADPGPIIQDIFSMRFYASFARYLLDGVIALVDAVHADEQMNQFTLARHGPAARPYSADCKPTSQAKQKNCVNAWRASTPVHRSTPSPTAVDIDLGLLFNTNGFMLEEKRRQPPSHVFTLSRTNETIFRRLWWNWITR